MARCLSTETLAAYAHELAEWVLCRESVLAPLVLPPPALTHWQQFNSNTVHKSQSGSGNTVFQLAARLAAEGVTRFIVAGGETSGVVTQSRE